MANRLTMDKFLGISSLRAAGYSERRIAEALGVSRGAVRRHLAAERSNSTTAQTGSAPTGSEDSNSTKAQTGSPSDPPAPTAPQSGSHCEPFRDIIIEKLEQGLHAKRIHQDLVAEHDFTGDQSWGTSLGGQAALRRDSLGGQAALRRNQFPWVKSRCVNGELRTVIRRLSPDPHLQETTGDLRNITTVHL